MYMQIRFWDPFPSFSLNLGRWDLNDGFDFDILLILLLIFAYFWYHNFLGIPFDIATDMIWLILITLVWYSVSIYGSRLLYEYEARRHSGERGAIYGYLEPRTRSRIFWYVIRYEVDFSSSEHWAVSNVFVIVDISVVGVFTWSHWRERMEWM